MDSLGLDSLQNITNPLADARGTVPGIPRYGSGSGHPGFDILVNESRMPYAKSVVSGTVALVVALSAVYASGLLTLLRLKNKYEVPGVDTFFVRWHWHFWPILGTAILAFALGFYWKFRRTSIGSSPR
jgi:hypothetical protein